jgi:putative aldouronate transport system permease protein
VKKIVLFKYRLLFIWLGLAHLLLFKFWPMLGLSIAFQEYSIGNGFFDGPWVGAEHFLTFFNNPNFSQVFINTVIISCYRLFFVFFPPILLAILLNEVAGNWFKKLVQTLVYLPHFLSWVIIYGICFIMLSEGNGLFNQWIRQSGGEAIGFLTSEEWFRAIIVSTDIWKDTGWGTIIYLAALTGINPQLYEAAVMDGANKWKQIWHITIPGLMPVIFLMFVLRLAHILDGGLEQILVFYNPLVYSVGDIIDTWVYRMGILEGRMSLAAAVGLFKSVIALALVLGANRLSKKITGSGVW